MPHAPDFEDKKTFAAIKQQIKGTISRTMPHKKENEKKEKDSSMKKELDDCPSEIEEESELTLKMRAKSVNRIIYKALSRTPLKVKQ